MTSGAHRDARTGSREAGPLRRRRSETAIAVDPVACDAFGYCADLLPELVTLDEWGYPVLGADRVPAWLAERAKEAVRRCPRRALHVRPVRDPAY